MALGAKNEFCGRHENMTMSFGHIQASPLFYTCQVCICEESIPCLSKDPNYINYCANCFTLWVLQYKITGTVNKHWRACQIYLTISLRIDLEKHEKYSLGLAINCANFDTGIKFLLRPGIYGKANSWNLETSVCVYKIEFL